MTARIILLFCAMALFGIEAVAQQTIPGDSVTGGILPETCRPFLSEDEQGVITGFVRDSATGVVLPDAHVSFTWDRGADRSVGERTTVTNAEGRYSVCPVPKGVPITLSATFPRRRAEGVVTLPADREVFRLDFRVTGQDPPKSDHPSRITLLPTGQAGDTATVTGTVRDETSGVPLVGAQVVVPELGIGTVTEPGGRFRLDDVPPGDHTLRVEHLGYRTAETDLTFDEPEDLTAVAWLVPQAIAMDALEATVPSRSGIEDRRSGASRYRVTREDFEKRPSATIGEILRAEVPGMRVYRDRRGCVILETRHGNALIVVDGVPFRDGCILNEIDPTTIESVEVLSAVAASTRWGSLGGGGVVVIRTRRQ
ncbi:MAG: carboxypeptidase regulatory-like domain-containing protein [Halobacteriales archaeon]|nr:carboxypeptidase regulatory-like domain-containing protein [Halobacteriales archaeon]